MLPHSKSELIVNTLFFLIIAEFQFRHNMSELTDGQRIIAAIKAAQGKRLTYAEQVGNAA